MKKIELTFTNGPVIYYREGGKEFSRKTDWKKKIFINFFASRFTYVEILVTVAKTKNINHSAPLSTVFCPNN